MNNITPITETIHEPNINVFEDYLGFKLPQDYKEFLLSYNGGEVKNSICHVTDLNEDILLDIFYGLSEQRVLDLKFWYNEHKYDLPENSLIIACDPGGNKFLLINNEIYYWDHIQFFESSDDKENTYFVADTFTEFTNKKIKA